MSNLQSQPVIELRQLEKSYPLASGVHFVLRQINLDIAAGEFVSITGPSGSGKTSLLNIIGLLDHDWKGEFKLSGEAVHKTGPAEWQQKIAKHKIVEIKNA